MNILLYYFDNYSRPMEMKFEQRPTAQAQPKHYFDKLPKYAFPVCHFLLIPMVEFVKDMS